MVKVKSLRIPLSTNVMMRTIKKHAGGTPTIAETIILIKNIEDPVKILQTLSQDEIDELLCAHYYTEKYHAAVSISTTENITQEDVQEAAAKVQEIITLLMKNNGSDDN